MTMMKSMTVSDRISPELRERFEKSPYVPDMLDEMLILYEQGQSYTGIARKLEVSYGTVNKYIEIAREYGFFDRLSDRECDGCEYKGDEELTELKPCPFCGRDVELRDKMDGRDETYMIHCNGCHMNFEKFVWRGCDESTVIKEWNRRVR